ncbi:hypothetical protein [Chlamydia sp.]|uniref:CT214 family putative inclusion membrane protein n=1 Tax=Chlamydia sp. TaxID=35827 RepID=UPI0025C05C51|nr:hypothetical protein [Chlamydia sp.]MBQ8498349.1 hypothetical protein [Chlamydia sp.]
MQVDFFSNSSNFSRDANRVLESKCDQAIVRSRQSQVIGIVSAIVAATLLLLLVIMFSVPVFPVAATIVVGVLFALSLVALTASFLVYIANAQLVAMRVKLLSSELQDHFSESSIWGTFRKSRDSVVSAVFDKKGDSFLPNRIGIKGFAMQDPRKNIMVDHRKYKQHFEKVRKEFALVCEGISDLIPTTKNAPFPIEASHIAGVFLVSFSPDKNPILKITRHAEKMLQSQQGFSNGMIWLCGALSDPEEIAAPFLSLLEKTQKGILVNDDLENDSERKLALESALLSLNIFFSGWCLGNPEHNHYLASLVVEKYKDIAVQERILDLLDTGNVIGAITLASGLSQGASQFSGIQDILREDDKTSKQGQKNKVYCLYEDIDPRRCLGVLPKQFDAQSSEKKESPDKQLRKLLEDLNDKIPSGVLGIITKATSANLETDFAEMLGVVQQLQILFDSYPPLSEQNIFLWLSASLAQVGLQKKLRTFLPSSEKKLLEKVLSLFLLGLYVRGIFSVKQIEQLSSICGTKDPEEFCQRIKDLSLMRTALPTLFN